MKRAIIAVMVSLTSQADSFEPIAYRSAIYNAFGGVGLLQTPTARLASAGEIAVYNHRSAPYRHMGMVLTPHPRFEGVVRYTDIEDVEYGVGDNQGYKDKGLNAKLLVLREDIWTPAVAVGLQDIGGTNLFSSEYLVASKRLGRIDASLGLGWGRLGASGGLSNPFKWLGSSFDTRDDVSDLGGTVTSGNFFAGDEAALFGGLSYDSPISGLRLMLEYEGNDYSDEFSDEIKASSPWNYGASWQVNDWVQINLGHERGEQISAGLVLRLDLTGQHQPQKSDPLPPALPAGPMSEDQWRERAEIAGFKVDSMSQSEQQVQLVGQFTQHSDRAHGLGRVGQALLPGLDNRNLSVIEHSHGLDLQQWDVQANVLEQRLNGTLDADEVALQAKPADRYVPIKPWRGEFSLRPDLDTFFHTPEDFVVYRASLKAAGHLDWRENTRLSGEIELGVIDNYDNQQVEFPSLLPVVRTDIKDYLREQSGSLALNSLALSHSVTLAPNWFGLAYAGLLETQYGGAGMEILNQPLNSRFAWGADINHAIKRVPDDLFELTGFNALTGHLSGYYSPVGLGYGGKLSVGRYLAGDFGATLDMYRQFANGARIGGWATKTTASAEEFGEGSFDKGVYVTLPLNLFSLGSRTGSTMLSWQPLLRDGGARLNRPIELHELIKDRYEIATHPERFGR